VSAHRVLRIGTRASQLAMWQAKRVAELLSALPEAPPVELVALRTEGDVRTDIPLWQAGGRAFFTREIDAAVLAGEADLAVHSLKDLPTSLDPGLVLSAVLEREDPRDALLAQPPLRLDELAAGARIGTSSLRRRAFLARLRPDLTVLELRGNVPTRVERLTRSEFDAIVLAAAGLKRLGLDKHITAYLPPEDFTPAVSQGAIAVVSRADDQSCARWLERLDHWATRIATLAERALLRTVEGGCQVPLGALASLEGDRLRLRALVCSLDGTSSATASGEITIREAHATVSTDSFPDARHLGYRCAEQLGARVGDELLGKGAKRIIEQQRSPAAVELP
jgi:hydroxymethylbilane synthase